MVSDLYDDGEFTNRFDYDSREIKIGFVNPYSTRTICINCFEDIVKPIPMIEVWKHTDNYHGVCDNPRPAPTIMLLQMINRPVSANEQERSGRKIICKKCFKTWDTIINKFFKFPPYKIGWMFGGSKSHYLGEHYQTLCGIVIDYHKRLDPISTVPTIKNQNDFFTCQVCKNRHKKLGSGKK